MCVSVRMGIESECNEFACINAMMGCAVMPCVPASAQTDLQKHVCPKEAEEMEKKEEVIDRQIT